jgi:hypothetical protein
VLKPALHRWPLFLLGLFVFTFLVWAWADSMKHGTIVYRVKYVEVGRGHRLVHDEGVSLDGGRLMIYGARVKTREPQLSEGVEPLTFRRGAATAGGRWFAKPVSERVQNDDMKEATIIWHWLGVPMWEIVGCYLVLWGGVLWWRLRRWRRSVSKI